MNLPLLSMAASLLGGAAGGLWGVALGLDTPVMELSSANFRDGLIAGAVEGLIPTLLIGILTMVWRRSGGSQGLDWRCPLASFVLNGLLMTGLICVQVAAIASC